MNKYFSTLIISLFIVSTSFYGQELNKKINKNTAINRTDEIGTAAATNDKMTIKDEDSNVLMEVIDEGAGGSIYLKPLPADITTFDNKLYNVGTELYWSGDPLGTSRNVGWETSTSTVRLNSISDKVGIGINSPSAKLHVFGDDGVLFEGTIDNGAISKEGAGTRMMWYPKKAAFRAGHISGTEWDDANIGAYSTALGLNSTASGISSIATGNYSIASGNYSMAIGISIASGEYSSAIGTSNASGDYSIAMGGSTASGHISTAMGYTTTSSYFSTSIGTLNIGGGDPINWIETDPLFEIGNSNDPNNRSNALTVLKNGNVGIGTATPSDVLSIIRNDDALVGLSISNTNTGSNSSEGIYFNNEEGSITGIRLYDDDHTYSSQMRLFNHRSNGSMHFLSENGELVLDKTGNLAVYSGDILTQGTNSFQSSGDEAILFLGDNFNYIKAVHGFGLKIGTFGVVNSAIAIEAGSGNVGIGTETPNSKLSIVGLNEYADNEVALSAGLVEGDLYRTGDLLKIVH